MSHLTEKNINERAQHFLKVLIERYIREGQPIGSRTLAKDSGMELSPATIRNVMSDLEELGFIVSPHTSAGRVPTVSGYRLFVDSLISLQPIEQNLMSQVQQELGITEPSARMVESASRLLSDMTHMAGVVMAPKRNQEKIRQIEFVPLSETRVLAVIVTTSDEIFNRIVETSRVFQRSELEQFSNYITQHYAGHDLKAVRYQVLGEMRRTRENMDKLMTEALQIAQQTFVDNQDDDSDIIFSGQTNLMNFDELAQMDQLRSLFSAFTEKQEILHLLDRCLEADGVQIFIGEESGYTTLKDCSVVTAPYVVDEEIVGVLGVIGPTRMAYDKVIPIVDITARLLGTALKSR